MCGVYYLLNKVLHLCVQSAEALLSDGFSQRFNCADKLISSTSFSVRRRDMNRLGGALSGRLDFTVTFTPPPDSPAVSLLCFCVDGLLLIPLRVLTAGSLRFVFLL